LIDLILVGLTRLVFSLCKGRVSARGARLQRLVRSTCGQGSALGGREGFLKIPLIPPLRKGENVRSWSKCVSPI